MSSELVSSSLAMNVATNNERPNLMVWLSSLVLASNSVRIMVLCHFAGTGIQPMQRVDADGNSRVLREAAVA